MLVCLAGEVSLDDDKRSDQSSEKFRSHCSGAGLLNILQKGNDV